MRSPVAGLLVAFAAALFGVLALATPASAEPSPAPTVTPLTPAEGATVPGHAALTWTALVGTGYEVRWNADGTRDADGALDPASGGRAFPRIASHVLLDLTAPTYHWQVRALPAGAWSSVATFSVDVQLETLTPPPATPTATPTSTEGPAPPVGGSTSPWHAFLWIAVASSVAGVILAVVYRERLRLRRGSRGDDD